MIATFVHMVGLLQCSRDVIHFQQEQIEKRNGMTSSVTHCSVHQIWLLLATFETGMAPSVTQCSVHQIRLPPKLSHFRTFCLATAALRQPCNNSPTLSQILLYFCADIVNERSHHSLWFCWLWMGAVFWKKVKYKEYHIKYGNPLIWGICISSGGSSLRWQSASSSQDVCYHYFQG